ncbi:response regulator [Edaphobacter sp. HDX4]|uniref:ATP-binding response regulator n=1 Tax=Edaphobacter sp. HDX4 TaxID=2794064 RepID=UPI002FE5999B
MSEPTLPLRALVIDDQDATRYIFRRILTRAGFSIDEASTGSEGLHKATNLPDIIISDVNLPDMLGYEVVRRLKQNPLTASIPVLQISAAFTSSESKVQGLEGGADSYLTQPVEPTVLIAQVNALLRMRRAESLSHLSALQWQTTFDALSDGLALADANGMVVRANAAFMHLLDFGHHEIDGRSLADVFNSRFELSFHEFFRRARHGHAVELSANRHWFRVRYDNIKTDLDQINGSILILADITDHKKLEETLKLSERLAATGRLAHIIAHEINNPLEAMSNLLYLAGQKSTERGDIDNYVAQASGELERISTITKQILAYHRESSVPTLVPAGNILESVLAMLNAHIAARGVRLRTQISCFQEILVHPGELRQVFNNVITNALDAAVAPKGQLLVRCINSKSYKTGRHGVRFIFSDSGAGIPEEVLPRIFEAFFTTKDSKGSGIGLWLSGEVIAKHDGLVRIRTRTQGQYQGTTFDLFIPYPR